MKKIYKLLIVIIIILLAGAYLIKPTIKDISYGIDLQGGFEILYNVEPLVPGEKLTSEDLSQTNSYRNLSIPNSYHHFNNLYITRKSSDINKNENLANIYSDSNKITLNKKFIEKEQPKSEDEIKQFVNNMLEYINYIISLNFEKYKMRNLVGLKSKIEVRNDDYINQGLKKEYYIDCLMKMQSELIYDKNGNKKSIVIDENKDFFSLF